VAGKVPNVLAGKCCVSKLGGKVARSRTIRQNFGGNITRIKVGWKSGRVANGTPKFGGKRRFSKLGGKVGGLGVVRQSFGGKMSCPKVGQKSGLAGNGTL
jgi:hypothetical protein